jgi:hypothetical protein
MELHQLEYFVAVPEEPCSLGRALCDEWLSSDGRDSVANSIVLSLAALLAL